MKTPRIPMTSRSCAGRFLALAIGLNLFAGSLHSFAQEARFFRVAGPVPTSISEFRPDGTLVWTNAATNATFTVQTASSLGSGTNWLDYVQMPITNGATTNRIIDPTPPAGMALIPAGSFTMGDNLDGTSFALPLHTVYVSAFYMDKYPVTKALWDDVVIWATNHGYSFDFAGLGKAPNHPVHTVDWYNCVKWCNARSELAGKTPAYFTSAAQTTVYRSGRVEMFHNTEKWDAGYRLSTEAEWEKAARGGASGQRFPWGNTITHSQANYYSSTNYAYDLATTRGYHPTFATGDYPHTSPVMAFAPNQYGLYDVAGNVCQWCWDWYGGYSSVSQADPRGPVSGSSRIFRGGSYSGDAFRCRAALRYNDFSVNNYDWLGFRSVLPAGQQ